MSFSKKFDIWNKHKKSIHKDGKCPKFYEGEIWWAKIGQNVSTEIFGKGKDFLRPVIILKRIYGNACIVIPLTSSVRIGNYYYSFNDSNNRFQCALLTQIRYLDGKRLQYKQARIDSSKLKILKNKLFEIIQ